MLPTEVRKTVGHAGFNIFDKAVADLYISGAGVIQMFSQGNFFEDLVMSLNSNLFCIVQVSTLLCFPTQSKINLPFCSKERLSKLWKLGSKTAASIKLKSHLVTFATLLGYRRTNWSAKIDIPHFDQNHQICKGFSQGNFSEDLVMSLNSNLFCIIQVSTLLCFQNTEQNEKICPLAANRGY